MTVRSTGVREVRSFGLDYVLAETNSYANNTAESALWATDWMLLGASNGIQRLYFHHGVGFRYNAIQPTSDSDNGLNLTHPHILPSYHAFLIVNEAIGKSGRSFVAEIPTTNLSLTAYGIWEDRELVRLVILNTQVYLDDSERPSIKVKLRGDLFGRPAIAKSLQAERTTSHTGLTWAGQSFETLSGRPEGNVSYTGVHNGELSLPASSIALVDFNPSTAV